MKAMKDSIYWIPKLNGPEEKRVRTFKDDTKGALSDLLAHAVVDADDVVGRARGVSVRHGVGGGGRRGKERTGGRTRPEERERRRL